MFCLFIVTRKTHRVDVNVKKEGGVFVIFLSMKHV